MPVCFAPIVDDKTEILIIGTMPSLASLEAEEYYAYKHNAFWKIIADIAHISHFENYQHKKNILAGLHLGLWDNLQFCEREGSLDSHIHHEIPNNFEELLAKYPQIHKLLFNGQKSYQFFKKYQAKLLNDYSYAVLPSTSPANATVCYMKKLEQWRQEIRRNVFRR